MKNFKHLKYLAVATLVILFSSVASGQVISQIMGGNSSTEWAVEVYNNTGSSLPSGTTYILQVISKVTGSGTTSTSQTITLQNDVDVNDVFVIGSGALNVGVVSINLPSGVEYFQGANISLIRADYPVILSSGGVSLDVLGNPTATDLWGAPNKFDDFHWEREIEFANLGFTSMVPPSPGVSSSGTAGVDLKYTMPSISVGGLIGVPFSQPTGDLDISGALAAGDVEGFGFGIGTKVWSATGWRQAGSSVPVSTLATTTNDVIDGDNNVIEFNNSATTEVKSINIRNNRTLKFGLDPNNKTVQFKLQPNQLKKFNSSYTIDFETEIAFTTLGWRFIGCPYASSWQASDFVGLGRYYWWGVDDDSGVETWQFGSGGSNLPTDNRGLYVKCVLDLSADVFGFIEQGQTFTITAGGLGANELLNSFEWSVDNSTADQVLTSAGAGQFSSQSGLNIIANPFTCCLDWQSIWDRYIDDVGAANKAINPTIFIRNPGGGWYSYNAETLDGPSGATINSGLVQPGGACLIQVTNTSIPSNTTFTASVITDGVLDTSASSFLKTGQSSEDYIEISLADSDGSASSTKIYNRSNSTINMDPTLDSWFRGLPVATLPEIFTLDYSTSGKIAINCADLNLTQSTALGLNKIESNKTYSIKLENHIPGVDVLLEDTYLDELLDLNTGIYTFTSNSIELNDRFILHFSPNQSLNQIENSFPENPYSYIQNDEVIFNPNGINVEYVSLTDNVGRLVVRTSVDNSEKKISLGNLITKGVYYINYESEGQFYSIKFIY